MCAAAATAPNFLSLFRLYTQQDCYYVFGTQAFYISRQLMAQTAGESLRTTCRMPIDLYFASIGPWPTVDTRLVEHVGSHFDGPPVGASTSGRDAL